MPPTVRQEKLMKQVLERLPIFEGKLGYAAFEWVTEFEFQCEIFDIQNLRATVFARSIRRPNIRRWYCDLNEETKMDYSLLKRAFLEEYVPKVFQKELEEKLRARKHEQGESVSKYARSFKLMISLMDVPMPMYRQCQEFRMGLQDDIRRRLPLSKNEDQLDEIIKFAVLCDGDEVMASKRISPKSTLLEGISEDEDDYYQDYFPSNTNFLKKQINEIAESKSTNDGMKKSLKRKKKTYPKQILREWKQQNCRNGANCKFLRLSSGCFFNHAL
mmetsp:Transcript_12827/g.16534  ORF Transcript_12827/g.16534 Transcript_12827/m.16534 type:complete len:273 (+) Transcript_12827:31-849(+)